VFCQLETLRHCLPPSVRRTLDELPESLDETYDHVLKDIKKPNRDHVRRLLQYLVVAIWPLDVKELAEVLAVDFDDADEIPKLKPDWRWEDEEQALLTSCSSLVTTVKTDDSRVVQFSHFSVKEYLTSERPRYFKWRYLSLSYLLSSQLIQSWRKLVLAFYSRQAIVLKRTASGRGLPWPFMLLRMGHPRTVREGVNVFTKGNGMSL
jgi:hypothetical protein